MPGRGLDQFAEHPRRGQGGAVTADLHLGREVASKGSAWCTSEMWLGLPRRSCGYPGFPMARSRMVLASASLSPVRWRSSR
jgi:hypothetical protein